MSAFLDRLLVVCIALLRFHWLFLWPLLWHRFYKGDNIYVVFVFWQNINLMLYQCLISTWAIFFYRFFTFDMRIFLYPFRKLFIKIFVVFIAGLQLLDILSDLRYDCNRWFVSIGVHNISNFLLVKVKISQDNGFSLRLKLKLTLTSANTSPRTSPVATVGFWGFSPPKLNSKPPQIETWYTINELSFCHFFECQALPQKRKAPFIENILAMVLAQIILIKPDLQL